MAALIALFCHNATNLYKRKAKSIRLGVFKLQFQGAVKRWAICGKHLLKKGGIFSKVKGGKILYFIVILLQKSGQKSW